MKHIFLYLSCISILFASTQCQEKSSEDELSNVPVDSLIKEQAPALPTLEETLIEQGLANIQTVDSTILVDLKYSTTDNFFGEDVYADLTNAYLQPDVAEKLKKVNEALQEKHPAYRLLVYDGVRPHSIQKILWEKLDSIPPKNRENYVADPQKGSIHNYGCAVDLTIFDMEKDSVLDMGTKYDYFGDLAYPRKETDMLRKKLLTKEQVENRQLLRKLMKAEGFIEITSEWWHFNALPLKEAERKYLIVK